MDNEISHSVHITISLMVISVVVVIINLFINQGQYFAREQVISITNTLNETYATEIFSAEYHGAVPATSLYMMLTKNSEAIRSLSGTVYSIPITKTEDLMQLFDKKVKIEILNPKDPAQLYDIRIKEENL